MKLTASKPAIYALGVCHPRLWFMARCIGLAAAYLHLVRCMAVRVIALVFLMTAISGCEKFTQLRAEQPWKWSISGIAETRRRGDLISTAIESYRTRIGKYPAALTDLQPEFLREIPQPTVGYKQWDYYLIYEDTNYNLGVLASEFGRQLFRTSGGWQTMDEHGLRNI